MGNRAVHTGAQSKLLKSSNVSLPSVLPAPQLPIWNQLEARSQGKPTANVSFENGAHSLHPAVNTAGQSQSRLYLGAFTNKDA